MDYKFYSDTESSTNSTKYSINWNISFLTSTTISSIRWNITLLKTLNDDMFRRLTPVVALLVSVMAVGTVGNIIICYVFLTKLRQSSQNFLLLCLGTFDLLSSCVGVPSEIFDIRHYYLYESAEACKAMRFLTTFPSLASILVLLVIAADRYRKICKPLYHQIHLSQARIAMVIIVVIAFVLSVPTLYIYGHRTLPTPIPGEYGYDCSVDDFYQGRQYPVIYEGTFCAAFIVCTTALVFIYVKIWLETKRHIKYMKTHAIFGPGLLDETPTTSSVTFDEPTSENAKQRTSQQSSRKSSAQSIGRKRFRNSRHKKGRRKSKTMPDEDDTVSQTYPVIGDTRLVSNEGSYSELISHNLQINDIVHDEINNVNGMSSQMIELGVIDKERGVYQTSTPPLLVSTNGVVRNFSYYDIKPDTDMADGGSEGTITFEDFENNESSTDDGVLSTNKSKLASNVQWPLSLKTVNEGEGIELQQLYHDQESYSPSGMHCESNAAKDDQSTSITTNNVLAESNHYNERPDLEFIHSNSLNNHTDPKHSPIDKQTIDSWKAYPERDYRGSGTLAGCKNGSDFDNRVCYSVTDSEDPLHAYMQDSKQCANKRNDETHPIHTVDKSHGKIECFSLNQPDFSGEKESSECQEDQESNPMKAETGIFRSNRVSFDTELNDLVYPTSMNDHRDCYFSPENVTRENEPHQQLHRSKSSQSLLNAKSTRKALRSKRTTILAFIITVGFILSYLPHLILIILRSVITNFDQQLNDVTLNTYNIFLRSYFANNIINIFVYGCMHLEFRTHIAGVWKRIKCWR